MEKQLPKNWLSIPFTDIFDINGGTQPPKSVFIDEPKEGYIRLLQIRDFGSKPVPTYIPDTGKLMTCKKDDILIARYGASIGRIVTGMEGSYNVALAKVSIPESINKNFVKWLLKSNIFQEPILSIQRTAQNGFNKNDLAEISIPLPPLAEQNRIVEKLDTLFAQLETIKTSMAKVPLLLKDFRLQVLTQAVTGKLTEEWRKGKELEKAKFYNIKNIIEKVKNSDPEKKHIEGMFNYFDIGSIDNKNYSIKDIKVINVEEAPSRARQELKKNDILLSTVRTYLKNTAFINFDINDKSYASTGFYVLRANSKIVLPQFLFYYVISDLFVNKLSEYQRGANYPAVRNGDVEIQEIFVPSLQEQHEIVSRVESLFAKADAIEKQYETLKAKIDTLPQAILHKAFKGELTQQLDSDGDARELLREIEGLKEAGKTLKSKKTKSVAKKV